MRSTLIVLATLASLTFAAAPAQAASPVDLDVTGLCDSFGVCLPPATYFLNGCQYNLLVLRGTLPIYGCAPTATAYYCEVDYFGGSGSFLGNFRFTCHPLVFDWSA